MRASSFVFVLLFVFGVTSAGAAPIGTITEFSSGLNPGANPAQVQAGPELPVETAHPSPVGLASDDGEPPVGVRARRRCA